MLQFAACSCRIRFIPRQRLIQIYIYIPKESKHDSGGSKQFPVDTLVQKEKHLAIHNVHVSCVPSKSWTQIHCYTSTTDHFYVSLNQSVFHFTYFLPEDERSDKLQFW